MLWVIGNLGLQNGNEKYDATNFVNNYGGPSIGVSQEAGALSIGCSAII